MGAKAAVFVLDEGGGEFFVYPRRGGKSPLSVRRDPRAQEDAVFVVEYGRKRNIKKRAGQAEGKSAQDRGASGEEGAAQARALQEIFAFVF